jgi:hypothetical protein
MATRTGKQSMFGGASPFFRGKNPLFRGMRIAGMVVFGIAAAAVFALVFGILVMLLWNWLMPLIFGLPQVTYWQAFGIVILAKLIFGTFGHGRHDHRKRRFDESWKNREPGEQPWHQEESPRTWWYWREFWRDEGKQAFEGYRARREAEEAQKTGKDAKDIPESSEEE